MPGRQGSDLLTFVPSESPGPGHMARDSSPPHRAKAGRRLAMDPAAGPSASADSVSTFLIHSLEDSGLCQEDRQGCLE